MIERVFPISITPEELATEFCSMRQDEQARFFSCVSDIVNNWDRPFAFQLQALIDDPNLTGGGRAIMELIGEYGEEGQ